MDFDLLPQLLVQYYFDLEIPGLHWACEQAVLSSAFWVWRVCRDKRVFPLTWEHEALKPLTVSSAATCAV